jgi:hypothetical protein
MRPARPAIAATAAMLPPAGLAPAPEPPAEEAPALKP